MVPRRERRVWGGQPHASYGVRRSSRRLRGPGRCDREGSTPAPASLLCARAARTWAEGCQAAGRSAIWQGAA
jgi:hypothetical protein